jgi:hypothetical protein
MNHAVIAVSMFLAGQAAGDSGQFEPIRVPARQAAPPADLGAPSEPAAAPGDPAPTANVPAEEPAAQPPAEVPDRYRSAEEPPASEEPPPDAGMESLGDQPRQKLRPPELIAEALENPAAEALPGAPLKLGEALAQTQDRQHQLKITKAYWKLAAAQAQYHWAVRVRHELDGQTQAHADLPGAASALAAAQADASDAILAVETAQHELSTLLRPFGQLSAPLATDRPHVGDYRMDFDRYFSGGAPPRVQLIHRTLPIRRKAIDAHAEAIVAASDAVESAGEQVRQSGRGLATLLDAIELLKQQRAAFIADVLDYNLDIADYAYAVDPPELRGRPLVGMLIRTAPPGAPARARGGATDPAIQKTFRKPSPNQGAAAADPDDWTANYAGETPAVADDPGVYQGLNEVASQPLRVQKLGNLLHWDRNLTADAGQPTSLVECLGNVPPPQRAAVIASFWKARETAARLQILHDEQEQFAALQSIAIGLRDQPGMAEAGVRLQAARRAARAEAFRAQLDLLTAQFELTQAVGRTLTGAWLLPTTAPQAGRYQVSQQGAARAPRWANLMQAEHARLQNRADAVIQCDADRAGLVLSARGNQPGEAGADDHLTLLDRVLWAAARQKRQTLAFLRELTEYNRAIAGYVLSTQPATISGKELAAKLAIARSTLRDS